MPPTGMSVHVGVNEADPVFGVKILKGCEADAISMHKIAVENHFEAADPLINGEANFEKVKAAILHAAEKLEAGGIFLFTFAGHGSFGPGFEEDEPEDGQDETILLHDCILIDNYLRRNLWSQFKKDVRILGIADSCHSGSVLFANHESPTSNGGHIGGVAIDAPAWQPPVDGCEKAARQPRRIFRSFTADDRRRIVKEHPDIHERLQLELLSGEKAKLKASLQTLGACQDNQEAVDNPDNGAFTGALLKVWNNGQFQGNYDDFITQIQARFLPTEQRPVRRPTEVAQFFREQRPFTI